MSCRSGHSLDLSLVYVALVLLNELLLARPHLDLVETGLANMRRYVIVAVLELVEHTKFVLASFKLKNKQTIYLICIVVFCRFL